MDEQGPIDPLGDSIFSPATWIQPPYLHFPMFTSLSTFNIQLRDCKYWMFPPILALLLSLSIDLLELW